MTCHRFLYKLCWKNRLVLPAVLVSALVLTIFLSLPSTDVHYLPDGQVRFRSGHRHALIPRDPHRGLPAVGAGTGPGAGAGAWAGAPAQQPPLYDSKEEVELVQRGGELHFHVDGEDEGGRVVGGAAGAAGGGLPKKSPRSGLGWLSEDAPLQPILEPIGAGPFRVHSQDQPRDRRGGAKHMRMDMDIPDSDPIVRQKGEQIVDSHFRDDNSVLAPAAPGFESLDRPDGGGGGHGNHEDTQAHKGKRKHPRKEKRTKFKRSFKPGWRKALYYDVRHPPEVFKQWTDSAEAQCDGRFAGYSNQFARLVDVIVDRDFCTSARRGGERIQQVINQPEDVEYYKYDMGCFQMDCSPRPSYYFNNENHLNDWLYNVQTRATSEAAVGATVDAFTVAVVRYEYANIYHTMTDWYNAFLLMQFFNKTPGQTNILLIDAHPTGKLDDVWPVLFNSTRRLSALPHRTKFKDLVWGILGYNSFLLEHYSPNAPLTEEFREYFLSSFKVEDRRVLDCQRLTVMFIWRRDYLAHPRNPSGTISRKINNEAQLLEAVQKDYPTFTVKGAQIDLFDMNKQLHLVASTDILVGMHGAGLTHALFLPRHAGLVELVPSYWSAANDHFYAIAGWRGLHYERWANDDPDNEVQESLTRVPPEVLSALIKNILRSMCPDGHQGRKNYPMDASEPRSTT